MNDGIKDELTIIKQDVSDIKRLLEGDWRTGKKGLAQSHFEMAKDVYNEKDGLLKRVSALETTDIKRVTATGAICAIVCGALWLIVYIVIPVTHK